MSTIARNAEYVGDNVFEMAVITSLNMGCCTIAEVSHQLFVSPRSLQRRLAEQGLTFRDEMTRVRIGLAERHLLSDDLSVDEISELVGYKNTVSFMRAFRQWTGMSVGQYRQMHGCVPRRKAA